MSPTEREQLRLSLLRYLAANRTAYYMPIPLLRQYLSSEGSVVEASEIHAELLYLQDKGFVAQATKAISPENVAYRITAAGRDLWAQTHGG